jgi:hypothetical protein
MIKDPLSLLLNLNWAEYLGHILISLGRKMEDIKMEMAILLFSLSEMILILSNLNVLIKSMKFIIVRII